MSWSVKDPNGDPLLFDLDLERADGLRLPVRRKFEGEQVAVDVTAAPDGRYRFHLSASDSQANPSAALTAEGSSSWFMVDSTSPEIMVQVNGNAWEIVVRDDSALAKVEASWDGESWISLEPEDGILDGAEERFSLPGEAGGHFVVVRAFDRHHNRSVKSIEGGS